MRSYWQRIVECGRDIHLFLVYALISYLGIGVFALMFNLYLVELGYDEGFIGAFNAVYTLSMGLTCLGIGFLINRFGNWLCIVIGTVEFTASMLVMCFATDSWLLLTLAAFNGIGSAFILTNQMPFVIEWTPKPHTATIAALSSALNSASIMLGSLLGGILPGIIAMAANVQTEGITSYRWTLATGAALTGLSLLPMLAMVTVRREKHHHDFQVAHAQLPNHRVRRQARRDIIAVTLLGLFLAFGVGAIEPFYNVLLEDMGTPTSSIGLIFAVSGLVTTVLSLAGPALARRLGLVAAQVWIRLYHVPIHLALIAFPTPAVVSLAYATRKISGAMGWPLESAHVGGLLPPAARAHAFGMRSASWNIGYAFAAFISGQVIARTGSYTPAYISLAIFCTLSVGVYVVAYGSRIPSDEPAEPKSATVSEVLPRSETPATTP
jgi:MFS family permease